MRSQRGPRRYLGALAGPLMLAGLLTGLSQAAPAPAPPPALAPVPACQTWTAVPPLNPGTQDNELDSVNVLSGTDAWAVGVSHDSGPEQTLTEHWDGSAWSVVPSPDPGSGNNFLFAVRGPSPTDVWAVGSFSNGAGSRSLILHWNGTAWTRVMSPDPGGSTSENDLSGVATTAGNTEWAVGSFDDSNNAQQALLLRWDGTSWQQVQIPVSEDSSGLSGVGASSSGNAWAVGSDVSGTTGQTLALHCS